MAAAALGSACVRAPCRKKEREREGEIFRFFLLEHCGGEGRGGLGVGVQVVAHKMMFVDSCL